MRHLSPGVCLRIAIIGLASLGACIAGCAGHNSADDAILSESPGRDIVAPEPSRGLEPPAKLAPALQRLSSASEASRDLAPADGGSGSLPPVNEVGYPVAGTKDVFDVAIHVKSDVDVKAVAAAGADIQVRLGNILYATVHARDLSQVAAVDGVERIAPMPGSTIPRPPATPVQTAPRGEGTRGLEPGTGEAAQFDHHGLTGKGTIVGIIDTGIDWHHPDFMSPDGTTSRILYLWDVSDNSWEESNHTVGSEPPMSANGKPLGTLYTNDQINAALKGQMKIARTDHVGHGTACASTAAGNDLGVAPEADLVIVNSYRDDPDHPFNDGFHGVQGAWWISQVAAQRHEPCVISLSYGGHMGPHDGTGEQEAGFNGVVKGGDAPGVVICASAGNEGEAIMHAHGRFGPRRPTELRGGIGTITQLFIQQETPLEAVFDSQDDWMLRIVGLDKFLVGSDGKPARVDFAKAQGNDKDDLDLHIIGSDNVTEADGQKITSLRKDKNIQASTLPGGSDVLLIDLPPGSYLVVAAGASEKVTHGVYDFYVPDNSSGTFGTGGDHKMVIGNPGDADSIITVGSYDFRNQWDNASGAMTRSDQVDLGNISPYSSPGFRRDGAVKPDIASPGQYTISAMADGSLMSKDGAAFVTKDGKHLAWAGTSASCPYTAGVIALMLEKNPQLTANQVKQILHDTADHDFAVTGAVPNPEWGYGKLNPEKALEKVTAGAAAPPVAPPSPVNPSPTPLLKSPFAGTFKGEGLTLVLTPTADKTFGGTLLKGDTTFPLDARLVASLLEGTVHGQAGDFTFTATLDGDKLMLNANGKVFELTRQAP